MHQEENRIVQSLELHLFFARIMKEHSLFLRAGFAPVDASFAREAEFYKQEFEKLLCQAVVLGDGLIGQPVIRSGELVTEFTARAEQQTERFTGIKINQDITAREARLRSGQSPVIRPELFRQVSMLNRTALRLLDGLIALKEAILKRVLDCRMFTMNYPLLIEHITREAKLYRNFVFRLENEGIVEPQPMRQTEQFWNQIMMEHALFIRGLLDPCENELLETADSFAKDYARLLSASCRAQDRANTGGGFNALTETIRFRDFKAAGTKGIEECKIRSLILPLLADHVLREANHYIRLLQA